MLKSPLRGLFALSCIVATSSLAAAQQPVSHAQIEALAHNPAVVAAMSACSDDRWRLCAGVMPGGGRIVRCLAAKPNALSPHCRSAMLEAQATITATEAAPPDAPAK
ncbi:MAG: hypothetical protein WC829_03640 [Hyphomicrobium sp.]|jgi:hypothetical protein